MTAVMSAEKPQMPSVKLWKHMQKHSTKSLSVLLKSATKSPLSLSVKTSLNSAVNERAGETAIKTIAAFRKRVEPDIIMKPEISDFVQIMLDAEAFDVESHGGELGSGLYV